MDGEKKLFEVGDVVYHRISGQAGIVVNRHVNPRCTHPEHKGPSMCAFVSVFEGHPNRCIHEPIDVYDISVGFGEVVKGVGGVLLSDDEQGVCKTMFANICKDVPNPSDNDWRHFFENLKGNMNFEVGMPERAYCLVCRAEILTESGYLCEDCANTKMSLKKEVK